MFREGGDEVELELGDCLSLIPLLSRLAIALMI